jgi:hypothetical protein
MKLIFIFYMLHSSKITVIWNCGTCQLHSYAENSYLLGKNKNHKEDYRNLV